MKDGSALWNGHKRVLGSVRHIASPMKSCLANTDQLHGHFANEALRGNPHNDFLLRSAGKTTDHSESYSSKSIKEKNRVLA